MTIKSAGEILVSEMREAVDRLKDCVTPLFDVNDKGEAVLLGSAVLISLSDDIFLCTAKHVIDENKTSTLYFDGPTKMEVLEGDFQCSKEHDVAVLKLTPEQVAAFQKYAPLAESEIADQSQTASSKYVEFLGFPETKNRKVYNQKKIKGLLHANGCNVIETTTARVRVSFNRKRNIDSETRARVTAPDPHGMSGGAMFGVPMDKETTEGTPHPRLVGLATDNPPNPEVFGPTIAIALAIIRDGWQVTLPTRLDPTNVSTNPPTV
ncbi:MAG: S1 family peptidase [Rhodospirillales bacterium]